MVARDCYSNHKSNYLLQIGCVSGSVLINVFVTGVTATDVTSHLKKSTSLYTSSLQELLLKPRSSFIFQNHNTSVRHVSHKITLLFFIYLFGLFLYHNYKKHSALF